MYNKSFVLITGAAGFIGSAISIKLLKQGRNVIGMDNLNSYYDEELKNNRLKHIELISNESDGVWIFIKCDLICREDIFDIFKKYTPEVVINLAAQAGVRYSTESPETYIQSNIVGFSNILDACVRNKVSNLLYASSSSVYGLNKKTPFEEIDRVDQPVSLYAATKRSNELIAHSYSNIYGLPCTGLRFFTVYGPWGRPDMAPMIFTKLILENSPIDVFNFGEMLRDFTYIDDVVECISLCSEKPVNLVNKSKSYCSNSIVQHQILNVGNGNPIKLMEFINILEEEIGIKAKINFKPMQIGDVTVTYASTNKMKNWVGYQPKVNIKKGIRLFIKWYLDYYSK